MNARGTFEGIGRLGESSLHAALKNWCAQPGDALEVEVDGYVIDIVRGDLLIEIQTGSFTHLKSKLRKLLADHRVQLVYPIAERKWIVRVNRDGAVLRRRKSPKRGRIEELFVELVRLPDLMAKAHFSLVVLFVDAEEVWRDDGQGSWRRKGWSIADQRLLAVNGQRSFDEPADLLALLPDSLPSPFTNRQLAEASVITLNLAGKMTYCLRKMGVLQVVGKRGNALLLARAE